MRSHWRSVVLRATLDGRLASLWHQRRQRLRRASERATFSRDPSRRHSGTSLCIHSSAALAVTPDFAAVPWTVKSVDIVPSLWRTLRLLQPLYHCQTNCASVALSSALTRQFGGLQGKIATLWLCISGLRAPFPVSLPFGQSFLYGHNRSLVNRFRGQLTGRILLKSGRLCGIMILVLVDEIPCRYALADQCSFKFTCSFPLCYLSSLTAFRRG